MSEQFNTGDVVYVTSYTTIEKATITRVTKTQAIISRGHYDQRFNRGTGRRLVDGTGYSRTSIQRPSEALDKRWREQRARQAALALSDAAQRGDEAAIREAFARWDKWVTA